MKISIFGLGYVGTVSAACFASYGHHVFGVDVVGDKVDSINNKITPVLEPHLQELIVDTVTNGHLRATNDVGEAIKHCDVALICVGTPSNPNGSFKMDYVERVCIEIGEVLANISDYKVVAIRSTLLPGVLDSLLIPALEKHSGKKIGQDFGLVVNPEFLREGTALSDFNAPPYTIIGQYDERAGDVVAQMYADIPAPIYRTEPDTASMVKYASNAYHALKVTFANEIGRLCSKFDINSTEVMDVFCQDTKLNVSARYLRPGFAFGGSCLPKDLRALVHVARHNDIEAPVLGAILRSNDHQVQLSIDDIKRTGSKDIAIIGLSFKQSTDDLRESPMLHVAETLLGQGYNIKIYDENVQLDRLVGSNKAYVEKSIPHIAALMCKSMDEALETAKVVVTAHGSNSKLQGLLRDDHILLDFSTMTPENKIMA
jgi:GDP-mannose 6-dehydrogenase